MVSCEGFSRSRHVRRFAQRELGAGAEPRERRAEIVGDVVERLLHRPDERLVSRRACD